MNNDSGKFDLDKYNEFVKKCIDVKGYFVHCLYENNINIHTHGLRKTYNHINLEIAVDIPHKYISNIFDGLIDKYIKQGITIDENMECSIDGYPRLKFKHIDHTDDSFDDSLRIIFPDNNGLFPDDNGCNERYSHQYEIID